VNWQSFTGRTNPANSWKHAHPPPLPCRRFLNTRYQPVISMKIFVAGAKGVLGHRLVPLLTAAGHEVTGLTRSQAKADLLRNMGAEPVVADARDSSGIMGAVRQAKPEIVVHELTSIKLRNLDRGFAETNRLRREGTGHLLAAAHVAGARRFVAQSFAGWPYAREGGVARLRRRRMRSIQIHQRRYTARSKRSATWNRRLPRKPAWRV
jgi:hypothetical protein